MTALRSLSALVVLFALTIALPALAGDRSGSPDITNGLGDQAYYDQVIFPAQMAGEELTQAQLDWLQGYFSRFNPDNQPIRDRRGGPDNFGYSWRDNREARIVYSWVDITAGAMRGQNMQNLSDNWNSGLLDLGWDFPFYGVNHNQLAISANGWISFSNTSDDFSPDARFPNNDDPENVIAAFFGDLRPNNGQIWFYTNPNTRSAVVTWMSMRNAANGGGYNFQIILTGDDRIKVQYQNTNRLPNNQTLSIGIQNADKSDGLSAWFDAGIGAPEAHYALMFAERFIDYANAGIEVIPRNLHFEDVFINGTDTMNARIENVGARTLRVYRMECDDQHFIVPNLVGNSLSIASGAHQFAPVVFHPTEVGELEATVRVICNAENAQDSVVTFQVTGRGVPGPHMVLDPPVIDAEIFTGEIQEHPITVTNDGGYRLDFTIDHQIIREGRDEAGREVRNADGSIGPRRDNPGDELGTFRWDRAPAWNYKSVAWDYDDDLMMLASYSQNAFAIADPNDGYRILREWNGPGNGNPMDIDYHEGTFYSVMWSSNRLAKWDVDGNSLGDLNTNFPPTAVASSKELGVLFVVDGNDCQIHVMSPDGNQVGSIPNGDVFNTIGGWTRGICWFEKHPGGQLWANTPGRLHQLEVDTDNWRIVREVQAFGVNSQSPQEWDSPTHDKYNLIWGSYGNDDYKILDDGIQETYWFAFGPDAGTLPPGESTVITVTLNADNLPTGEFEADLHFHTNDPGNQELVYNVLAHVSGAPVIEVTWPEEFGYPQEVNWNANYDEVFNNAQLSMDVVVKNRGTDELEVDGLEFDNNAFTGAPDQFVLMPRQTQVVTVFLDTPDSGVHEGAMTISSNAGNNRAYEVQLRAETFAPPIIHVEPGAVEDQLATGEIHRHDLTITNNGEATLRWESEVQVIREPGGRDARNGRDIRNVGPETGQNDAAQGLANALALPSTDASWNAISAKSTVQNSVPVSHGGGSPRRDVPESNYLFVGEASPWGYDLENDFRAIEGLQYTRIRTPNQLDDVDLGDFDVIYFGNYESDDWTNQYNNHRAVIDDFVDHGGSYYMSTGTNNWGVAATQPGGLVRTAQSYSSTAISMLTQDENWLMQYEGWDPGHQVHGNSFNHATYSVENLEAIENSDGYQVLFMATDQGQIPAVVVYSYGRGMCVAAGTTDGFLQNNYNRDGEWGWAMRRGDLLLYLDQLANATGWAYLEPDAGDVPAGQDGVATVVLDGTGLIGGDYEADLHILNNDPRNQDLIINIVLTVIGAPVIEVEWDEAAGFPNWIDFNAVFNPDLFSGGPYSVPILVNNIGTEALEVDDILSDNDAFSADPTQFVVNVGATQTVNIILNARENGVHEGALNIQSNAHNGDFEISVRGETSTPPIWHVEPEALEADLATGETGDLTFTISNNGEAPLRYTSDFEAAREPGRDASGREVRNADGKTGPRRDDPGEELGTFTWNMAGQWSYKSGIAFDPDDELLFLTNYSQNRAGVVDPNNDYAEVRAWGTPSNCMNAAYLDGVFYLTPLGNQFYYRFDIEGNNLGNFGVNFAAYGIAASQELGLLFGLSGNDNNIHVLDVANNQEVGVIQAQNYWQFVGGGWVYSIGWCDKDRDGMFWVNKPGHIYQLEIDTETWQVAGVVNNWATNVPNAQPYDGVGHDRYNIIYGSYGTDHYIIYDDGNSEAYWFGYDPDAGEVASGAELDVTVHLDAEGLLGGRWDAMIHFYTNDPAAHLVDFPITLNVEGAPVIRGEWDDNLGYPAVLDFNRGFQEVFSGGPYDLPVTLRNAGTDQLTVNDIVSDNNNFTVSPTQFQLDPDVEQVIIVTVNAPENGIHEGAITVQSNAHNGDFEIPVRAETVTSPTVGLNVQELNEDLNEGEQSQQVLTLSNNGGSVLRWTSLFQDQHERDNGLREVRSVEGRAGLAAGPVREGQPRRDPAGEELGAFNWNRAGLNAYKSSTWDYDDDLMFLGSYSPNWMAVVDPNNNYQTVRDWNPNGNCMDIEYLEGACYGVMWWSQRLAKYDVQGNNLGDLNLNFPPTAVAASKELGYLFVVDGNDCSMHVITPDGNQIAAIPNGDIFNNLGGWTRGICWVDKDIDAPLWINRPGRLYQMQVDTQNWRLTGIAQQFDVRSNNPQEWDNPSHDKYNLIYGSYGNDGFKILDDGVSESYWFGYDPRDGEIAENGSTDIVCSFNATGMLGGDYRGDLHLFTNDPNARDVDVPVTLSVTGIPAIALNWSTDLGYPNSLDFNRGYTDLFTGGPYSLTLNVINTGSDDLTVRDITSNSNTYTADPTNFVVVARDTAHVSINFFARENGDHNGRITVTSDARNGEQAFSVRGRSVTSAVAQVTPEDMWVNLDRDSTHQVVVTVTNSGANVLRWNTDFEENEQQRDNVRRDVRDVGAVRPAAAVADIIAPIVPNSADPIWNTGYRPERVAGPVNYPRMGSPRRDDPSSVFLLVQQTNPWGWDLEQDFRAVQNLQYRRIQTPDQLAGVNLRDYDVIYFGNYESDDWTNQYNNHLAAIEDFVDGGGTYYMCTGTNNWGAAPTNPGGLVRHAQTYCGTATSQPQRADNWFLNYEGWDQGHPIHGNSVSHAAFDVDALNGIQNTDGYQVVFLGSENNLPIIVEYSYGRGMCVVTGTTDGHQEGNWNNEGEWGWALRRGDLLLYLDALANVTRWFDWEPSNGTNAAGARRNITCTFDATDLDNGDYTGDFHILTNDPNHRDVILPVHLHVGPIQLAHFNHWVETPDRKTLSITAITWDNNAVAAGWEIGVFTPGGVEAGGARWLGQATSMLVFGDDPNTQEVEGFAAGEAMTFKVWDHEADVEHIMTPAFAAGDGAWNAGAQARLALSGVSAYHCNVHLNAGWNLMSINIQPQDNMLLQAGANAGRPDIRRMAAAFVDQLVLMKDELGHFYAPHILGGFSNIPYWNTSRGYQMNLNAPVDAVWTGQKIPDRADLALRAGWNIMGYYPSYQLSCNRQTNPRYYVLSPIIGHVVLAKDVLGRFVSPRNNFSNMIPWREGQGYSINLDSALTFNYPASEGRFATVLPVEPVEGEVVAGHWAEIAPTGENMSLLIGEISRIKVANGDQVAAFSIDGRLVGVGRVEDGRVGLAVWGDDAATEAVDGLKNGDAFALKLWSSRSGEVSDLSLTRIDLGEGLKYTRDGFTVASVEASAQIPSEFSLSQNYPNPFNGVTRLSFGLPNDAHVAIRVFDLGGRLAATLLDGDVKAGYHTSLWNAEGYASGVYVVKMTAPNFTSAIKVALMK